MKDVFSAILQEIQTCKKESLLIAIDGRCASGKTTLAARLKEETNCNVIHMDHFFLQPKQRTQERFNEPGGNVDYERFMEEVMLPLRKGLPFFYRRFDCKSMDFVSDIRVEPNALTIVEGTYCCHPTLWDFYDFRIFLTIDEQEQMRRIRLRNGEKASVIFRNRWIPMEESYFSACRVMDRCEFKFQLSF